ncbi:uncharacterized protein [Clytia hemisphaerica]|uniref:uncharacterized protein n=1 Tax=Clytia hemisphaerica TaxID=252671 RepID=UPI0034D4EEDC
MDEPLALEKEHTIEYFRLFSTIALKQYLELRKKSTVGSFETLVARAFTAYEENVPVDIELEHRQRTLLSEYKKKFEDLSLSDPMTMKAGWVGEEQGIKTWPSIYFMDISYYYKSVISKQDLWQRVECEYKEGKAFRYFSNGFLGEVKGMKIKIIQSLYLTSWDTLKKPLSDDMRFGISMEMHAKKIYRSKNAKTHKNLKVKESGLVILESHPWIGASPDLLVECDCHGLGLVEIKCPGSIRNQAPTSSNYKHLKSINGKDILNISSEYYCQIQGQMALTKRSYTDFFVLTLKGYHCSRIYFDKDFWDLMN